MVNPYLPIVYFFEQAGEDVLVVVGIDHGVDEPEFVIGHDLRVIAVVFDKTAVFVLRTREDEVIAAEVAVCGMKHLCQRVHTVL